MAAVKTSIFMIINWDNKLDRLLIIFIIQAVKKYPIVPLIFFYSKEFIQNKAYPHNLPHSTCFFCIKTKMMSQKQVYRTFYSIYKLIKNKNWVSLCHSVHIRLSDDYYYCFWAWYVCWTKRLIRESSQWHE